MDDAIEPVVAGLASALACRWSREVVRLRAGARELVNAFGWSRLAHLIEWTPLEPPRLQLVRHGEALERHRFIREVNGCSRADASAMQVLLDKGWQLVLRELDRLDPEVARLVAAVDEHFPGHAWANCYAASAQNAQRSEALGLHADGHDVLVLQIDGRKEWSVWESVKGDPLSGRDAPLPSADTPPAWSGTLEAGDVLHIPRGYPHRVLAIQGEASLHLTIGFRRAKARDYLHWLVDRLADDYAAVRERLPAAFPGLDTDGADAGLAAKLTAALGNAITSQSIDLYRQEYAAERLARPRLDFTGARQAGADWTPATRLRLVSLPCLSVDRTGDSPMVKLASGWWPCSEAMARSFERLSPRPESFGQLAVGLDDEERRKFESLLRLAFDTGLLASEDPGSPPA